LASGSVPGFRALRRRRTERLSLDYDDLPDNHRLAIAFDALSGANSSLALLNRYQSRLHHEYHRLLKTLGQMQSAQARTPKLPNAW
jgi:hypothetical protein